MKNRKSIFAFFAISAAMIFASCSNLTDANVTSSSEDKNTLNIEVTNYDEVVTQASKSANHASRTIIPDSFDSTGVVFYLYGTNTSGGTFGPEKVDFTPKTGSNTIGTISIPANSAVWEFTLVALATGATAPTDETTLKNDAVLIGYSSMDMLNGDTAKFTLSPDGLTKKAEIAMKLYTDGWALPTGFTAKAGIYLLTTGADAGTDAAPTEKEVAFTDATKDEANAVAYTIASFTPGTYLFKVTFEKTGSNKKFYWSDVLVVLPGKTINNAVGIPNVIGEKPEAPTAFKAMWKTARTSSPAGTLQHLNGNAVLKTKTILKSKFLNLMMQTQQLLFQPVTMNGQQHRQPEVTKLMTANLAQKQTTKAAHFFLETQRLSSALNLENAILQESAR